MRCFCEVVKTAEAQCIESGKLRERCLDRTTEWLSRSVQLFQRNMHLGRVPQRGRVVAIEP